MIELLRFREMEKVGLLQSILEAEGIPTYIRNQDLSTTALPISDFAPALCITNDADKDRAVALIRDHLQTEPAAPGTEHTCPKCGERSPGNFAACWSCGAALDG